MYIENLGSNRNNAIKEIADNLGNTYERQHYDESFMFKYNNAKSFPSQFLKEAFGLNGSEQPVPPTPPGPDRDMWLRPEVGFENYININYKVKLGDKLFVRWALTDCPSVPKVGTTVYTTLGFRESGTYSSGSQFYISNRHGDDGNGPYSRIELDYGNAGFVESEDDILAYDNSGYLVRGNKTGYIYEAQYLFKRPSDNADTYLKQYTDYTNYQQGIYLEKHHTTPDNNILFDGSVIECTRPIYLFGLNLGDSVANTARGHIAINSVTIVDKNNHLVLDLVPFYDEESDECGMFDVVSSTFYKFNVEGRNNIVGTYDEVVDS